ncbi:MAG: CBS domain-containing protein [Planctomycetes bacterium]|nr:CBS domain-containing protein [Planctomycetota bacterium]
MNSAIERLLSLHVSDVMTRNVVQISAHQTMAEVAQLMVKYEISGAPVVDEQGRCVGILSSFDFAAREEAQCATTETPCGKVQHVLVHERPDQAYHIEDVATDMVANFMSPAVQTVRPTATLMEAARVMCTAHIHRLVVLDGQGRPVGIVSSLDLVAALVKAVEE